MESLGLELFGFEGLRSVARHDVKWTLYCLYLQGTASCLCSLAMHSTLVMGGSCVWGMAGHKSSAPTSANVRTARTSA